MATLGGLRRCHGGLHREADQTYVVGLARRAGMERQVASQLLQRFNELGVFAWQSGPRGSHTPGTLTLPSRGQSGTGSGASGGHSGTMSRPPQGVTVAPLHNSELSIESEAAPLDAGAHHSPLIGHPDGVEGSDSWHAEGRATQEVRPEHDAFDDLDAAVQAAYARGDLVELLPPFHADERTGDGTCAHDAREKT